MATQSSTRSLQFCLHWRRRRFCRAPQPREVWFGWWAYGMSRVAFSPAGTRVVTAFEDKVHVWLANGIGEPVLLHRHPGTVYVAAFSPDGTRIVTAFEDGTARVWRANGTGEPLILRGHEGDLSSAVFSPDGTKVVIASADGTARVWRVTWPGLLEYLRENIDACLTPKQRIRFLAESPSDARDAHAACEGRHGRRVKVGGHNEPELDRRPVD